MKRKKERVMRYQSTRRIHNGYIQIKIGLKWIFDHRLAVENFIGRELTPEEVVHHIDFNKKNNSISNLMLFPDQNEHQKFHIYFEKYGFNQRVRRIIQERWKLYKN